MDSERKYLIIMEIYFFAKKRHLNKLNGMLEIGNPGQ